MQQDFPQMLTTIIEFIKNTIDSLKLYLLGHPTEVFLIVCALIAGVILIYYLPKIVAQLYKDLMQLLWILTKWSIVIIILLFAIWTIVSFPSTCKFINEHLHTDIDCKDEKLGT